MSYEKLKDFCLYVRAIQETDLDALIITTAPKGFGKSSFIIQAARVYSRLFAVACSDCGHEFIYTNKCIVPGEYGHLAIRGKNLTEPCTNCGSINVYKPKKFNFRKYLAYDADEVKEIIYNVPDYSPILPDEGVNFLMAEDWNRAENKEMKKLFAVMRTKHLIVLTNIQKFRWSDRKFKDDMCTFWIRILMRSLAIMMQPDLGESQDPWDMPLFEKLLGRYFYLTPPEEIRARAQKIIDKHPCAFDYLSIPKVPEAIYQEYLAVRNEKAFARKNQELDIDQKELAKIMAHNLVNRWEEIQGAVKMSRFGKPTYKILEQFIFSDPVTGDCIQKHSMIGNYINEVERIVRKRRLNPTNNFK